MSCDLSDDIELDIPFFTIRKNKFEEINLKNVDNSIPIIIKDIPNISLNPSFAGILRFRGVQFRYVVIFGRAYPGGKPSSDHLLHYIVDDGSGYILVKYPQRRIHFANQAMVNNLEKELGVHRRKAGSSNSGDREENARPPVELIKSMETVLNKIKRNALVPQEHYPRGSKVSVIGFPFKSFVTGEINLYAIEMVEHKELSADKELFFRKNVIDFYRRTINYKKEL